jgi:hypothetical protein
MEAPGVSVSGYVMNRRTAADHSGLVADLIAHEREWHYQGGRRDLRLDLMRGFAAFAMIADHIGGSGSWLYALTGGNDFFVSAAEAFVFISGAVMGIVYLHIFETRGLPAMLMKTLHRAKELYVLTVVLTLALALLVAALDLPWRADVSDGGTLRFALDVVTLHRTFHLTDVMMLYTFLLLGAGLVLLLLSQGRTVIVIATSWSIWALWQLAPDSAQIPWEIKDNILFNVAAWQVLFVTGIVLGWHQRKIESFIRSLPAPWVVGTVAVSTLLVGAMYVVQLFAMDDLQGNDFLRGLVYDKPDVAIGRLAVCVVLGTVAFSLTTLLWQPIRRATAWLLLPLGQNALAAYSLHLFVVALTTKLTRDLYGDDTPARLYSTALQIAGVLLVWAVVLCEPGLRTRLGAALVRPQNPNNM